MSRGQIGEGIQELLLVCCIAAVALTGFSALIQTTPPASIGAVSSYDVLNWSMAALIAGVGGVGLVVAALIALTSRSSR